MKNYAFDEKCCFQNNTFCGFLLEWKVLRCNVFFVNYFCSCVFESAYLGVSTSGRWKKTKKHKKFQVVKRWTWMRFCSVSQGRIPYLVKSSKNAIFHVFWPIICQRVFLETVKYAVFEYSILVGSRKSRFFHRSEKSKLNLKPHFDHGT